MEKFKMPLGPFVIGFVLSPIAEIQLRSGLMASEGSLAPMFLRPFAVTFLIITFLSLLWPVYLKLKKQNNTNQ